jgi:hypothetical protein
MINHKAIYNTHSTVASISGDGKTAFDLNSNPVKLNQDLIDVEAERLKAEYDAQAYARNRQAEYPDWGTQLNKIYDDGLTKWKSEMVDPVKAKWPKDNSGPK